MAKNKKSTAKPKARKSTEKPQTTKQSNGGTKHRGTEQPVKR